MPPRRQDTALKRIGINIKCAPALRARIDVAAELEGVTPAEFMRAAFVAACEKTERLAGTRKRAAASVGERE